MKAMRSSRLPECTIYCISRFEPLKIFFNALSRPHQTVQCRCAVTLASPFLDNASIMKKRPSRKNRPRSGKAALTLAHVLQASCFVDDLDFITCRYRSLAKNADEHAFTRHNAISYLMIDSAVRMAFFADLG